MFIGNKKCRIYAACGVSQTPNKNVCKEVIVSILCEVDFNINNNLYFVGTFSAEEIIENRKRLDKIISESIKCHKSIISILPLDTIINRICLINDYGIISKSFYI